MRALSTTEGRVFRGCHFPAEVILGTARSSLQLPLGYQDLERMLADRGVAVDHVTLHRWVLRFAPEFEQRTHRHLPPYPRHSRPAHELPRRAAGDEAQGKLGRFTRHRRGRWLNNLVEQDHRRIKRRVRRPLGFKQFTRARQTLVGAEAMAMLSKGQVRALPANDTPAQRAFVHQVFGLAA